MGFKPNLYQMIDNTTVEVIPFVFFSLSQSLLISLTLFLFHPLQGSETIMSGNPVQHPVVPSSGLPAVPFDAIPAPDVPLHMAKKNFEFAKSEEEREVALREYGKLM